MDFKSFIFIAIACICVLHKVEAGCKDELMASNEDCFNSYQTYLVDLSNSGKQMTNMITYICNEEGQAATKCLMPLIAQCDELKGDPTYQTFTIIQHQGGCEALAKSGGVPVMGGGSGMGNSVCSKAGMECMSGGSNTEDADQDADNATTQFNMFQEQIKSICGDLRLTFVCMKKYEKECPDLESKYKQMYESNMQPGGGDKPLPSFDLQKQFVMNQCPKFPVDFSTNACLMDNLKTKQYIDCYKNATSDSKQELTCDQFKSGFECVKTALKTCGDKHKSAFTATANFYLDVIFKDECKVEMMKETSGAGVTMLSLCTMFIGFVLTSFL